jgi:hypothetical protein
MTNPNPGYNRAIIAPATDPFDEPGFDYWRYIDETFEEIRRHDPVVLFRQELRQRASAAGFVDAHVCHLNEGDFWELRCRRGANAQCADAEEVERWLQYVARQSGHRIEPGRVVAVVLEDRIAAKFSLEPAEPAVPA